MPNYSYIFNSQITNDYDEIDDTDSFSDESDVDRTGLDNELDALDDQNIFEFDDQFAEYSEPIDEDADDYAEEAQDINEVDEDTDPGESEPDFDPSDVDWMDFDTSDENDATSDLDLKDEPYDEWSEVSPWEEILQGDDTDPGDSISQLEETGWDEPLYYENLDTDLDLNPIDDIEEVIYEPTEKIDWSEVGITIEQYINETLSDAANWANREPAVDFTNILFDEMPTEGIQLEDYYDPDIINDPLGDEVINLPAHIDDVFVDLGLGDDMGVQFFQFMDIFDSIDSNLFS